MSGQSTSESRETAEPIVIDLGKKSRKQIRRLRKGRGRLMQRVHDAIEDLRRDGEIAADAQTVITVVRRRRRKLGLW